MSNAPVRALGASTFGLAEPVTAPRVPRPASFFEFGDQSSWFVRGQNFCIGYVALAAGATFTEGALPDEHVILVPDPGRIVVAMEGGDPVQVTGPALVIVPPGACTVTASATSNLLRIFTTRSRAVTDRAANGADYAVADAMVTALPMAPRVSGPGTLRVHPLADVASDSGRLGRIFQTDTITVNWFAPLEGPRDSDSLSPHVHTDFEQASVTLGGRHVHHIRRPWSRRLRDWREDEHAECGSPPVTLIPPGNIHTTQAVGPGLHHLVDVFAPHRRDFLEQGWVLNAGDYTPPTVRP